jgi:hypothetical protein
MSEPEDLRVLSVDQFSPHIGSTFRLPVDDQTDLELELVEVVGRKGDTVEGAQRQPFSILFRGPTDRVFEQQTCSMVHSVLGELSLFLVPLEPDKEGARYEAVFS